MAHWEPLPSEGSWKSRQLIRGVYLCCIALLVACHSTTPLERFDQLVTLELVLPQPADRARYLQSAPETRDRQRAYGFQLKSQPGMVPNRHFHLIAIVVAPAGTFLDLPEGVDEAAFDMTATAAELVRRYGELEPREEKTR